jgi:Cu(I)/Ag(I) efflux system membrane protein CusA/SilA
MIDAVLRFSVRHRLTVFAATLALAGLGVFSMNRVKLDAIPDLSEPQVVVFSEYAGQSPSIVEDQVTFPIVSSLVSAPHVTDVRGFSMFGMSFVYVIFEEDTDLYWARSRVLEYMGGIRERLPKGVTPVLGPDATGIGWVYAYVLSAPDGALDLAELRTLQNYTLRYALGSVPGVAEVASVGGYEKELQIKADPDKLRSFGLSFSDLSRALDAVSSEVGGRLLELSGREYYVRGRAYAKSLDDLRALPLRSELGTRPVVLSDVAEVAFGPGLRRGAVDWNGEGDAVAGIVVMRQGENARDVIMRVKDKLAELKPALPAGVHIDVAYDRSSLIDRAIETLRHALLEEMAVVALAVLLFLLHVQSALLPMATLPLAVLLAFIPMAAFGIPATIMSLGGIAIAIGATVDAEIVMIEAAHKALERYRRGMDRSAMLAQATREVAPAIFFSLLIIAVSFLPVFALPGQAGRLFKPLAYTKTFVMLASALLSITFAPAMRDLLVRGRIHSEENHPISKAIRRVYEPFVYVALRRPKSTLLIGFFALISAVPLARELGEEFMPALDEGDLLFMPTTYAGISLEEARQELTRQDRVLKRFPEVESVFGKVGRADTPTDPAPLSMVETTIRLKPKADFRDVQRPRFYSGLTEGGLKSMLRRVFPDTRKLTRDELVAELDAALPTPGFTKAWTMPIRTRIDMQSTGIRTPIGIKIFGKTLEDIDHTGGELEHVMHSVQGTRSAFYERSSGGSYVDIVPDRARVARAGLMLADVQATIEGAVGGQVVGTTVDGRSRFDILLRLDASHRQSVEDLARLPLSLPSMDKGQSRVVALGDVAEIKVSEGPPMIRDEDASLVGYVYVDLDPARDLGGYVDAAKLAVQAARSSGQLTLPEGTYLKWSGQFELMEATRARLKVVVPLALLLATLLLFAAFRNLVEVLIVLLSIPFALVGSVWLLWLLDYRLSTAVWVGIIALLGLATQTGVVMVVYIDAAYERRKRAGKIRGLSDIVWAHMEGTVLRVRPKLMTVSTMFAGLLPLLWADGAGADVMKRIAAPMVGGLFTSAFLTLELIPVVYTYWRYEQLVWERAKAEMPALLLRLEAAARLLGTALFVLVALPVLGLYLALPRDAALGLAALATAVALAASGIYLQLRRVVAKSPGVGYMMNN